MVHAHALCCCTHASSLRILSDSVWLVLWRPARDVRRYSTRRGVTLARLLPRHHPSLLRTGEAIGSIKSTSFN